MIPGHSLYPQLFRGQGIFGLHGVVIPSLLKTLQAPIDPWKVDIVETEKMEFVIDIQSMLLFKESEKVVKHNSAALKHISPQPLNSRIVDTFPRNERSSSRTSFWMR